MDSLPIPAPASLTSRRRVFFVDDHPLVREWLASMVELEADLVVCGQAADAVAALSQLPAAAPDLMVVDLSLPRGSGLELIKNVRDRYPALRILVLSMHDEASMAERALRAGANGYAIKGESGPEILKGMRAVLDGRFFASGSLATQLAGRLYGGAQKDAASPEEVLSDRELEVFRLRGEGRNSKEIAGHLGVSAKTVGTYEQHIKDKLGYAGMGELIREAVLWIERKRRL